MKFEQLDGRWLLKDTSGCLVGRFSSRFIVPAGKTLLSAYVAAILVRKRQDSEPEYQVNCRCDQWEVIVPALVLSPRA